MLPTTETENDAALKMLLSDDWDFLEMLDSTLDELTCAHDAIELQDSSAVVPHHHHHQL